MDIRFGRTGVANSLSNLFARSFVFRGVQCASMEGFLQGLKCEDADRQKKLCLKTGHPAKSSGRNIPWWEKQTLYWNGQPILRNSQEYQDLLDEAYWAMFAQNPAAVSDLLSTGNAVLTHKTGHNNMERTILTENEFCQRLMRIRASYQLDTHLK